MNLLVEIGHLFFFTLLHSSICSFISTDLSITSESITERQLQYVNSQRNSLLRIINYSGFDINLSIVSQPVVLVKYFVLNNKFLPVELLKNSYYNITELRKILKRKINYARKLFDESPWMLGKSLSSEVIVYLHPPNQNQSPSFYQKRWWTNRLVLRDPYRFELGYKNWNWDFLSTMPKLSLLICESGRGHTCNDEYHKETWITSVIGANIQKRNIEIIQILESSENGERLSMLCPYCNPCNPLQMVHITRDMNTLFYNSKITDQITIPHSIRVVLYFGPLEMYGNVNEKGAKTRNGLLKHISKIDLITDVQFLIHSIDIHALDLLFPKNTTLHYSVEYERDWDNSKEVYVEGCSNNPINYLGRLRPFIGRKSAENIANFPEIGLILKKSQFHFVSCHEETSHWITQLRELVLAFDAATWLLMIAMAVVFPRTFAYFSLEHHKKSKRNTCWDFGFFFAASLVDQSTKLFDQPVKGRILLFWLPLMLFILGNVYKGENITNLTVAPGYIPFDTFDVLVNNGFDIRSKRKALREKDQQSIQKNAGVVMNYSKKSNHEAFPIISEIWFNILVRFYTEEFSTLEALKHRIPKTSLFYLNHSQMLPEWTMENGEYGGYETVERILSMHMNKCHKTAMILSESTALQLFTILKTAKKPAFYGKDVINENFIGYLYRGFFPNIIYRRIKHSFSSGIIDHWQKYLKWFVILKTKYSFEQNRIVKVDENEGNNGSGVYVLALIPSFGLILAIIVFTCYDCQAMKATFDCFGTIAKTFARKPTNQPKFYSTVVEPMSHLLTKKLNENTCPFCSEKNFVTGNDLSKHLVDSHAQLFFVDSLVINEDFGEFHDLSTLVLNSEIEAIKSGEQGSMLETNLDCPYGCIDTKIEDQLSLKLHLIKDHRSLLSDKLENLVSISRR